MTGFFCEPTRLVTNPEKPDFLRCMGGFDSLPSFECRFVVTAASGSLSMCLSTDTFSKLVDSMLAELLGVWGAMLANGVSALGLTDAEVVGDDWNEGLGLAYLTDSMRLRIAAPSKGAPIRSSVWSLLCRQTVEAERRLGRCAEVVYAVVVVELALAKKSPWAPAGDALDHQWDGAGCLGDELADVSSDDGSGGALGARWRLWELRWLSRPEEERGYECV